MNTIRHQLIAAGEIPEQRKMSDLSLGEVDAGIGSLELRLESATHMGSRNAAQLALLALYKYRHTLAPPQLPAVPEGVEACSLNDGPLTLPQAVGTIMVVRLADVEQPPVAQPQPVLVAA